MRKFAFLILCLFFAVKISAQTAAIDPSLTESAVTLKTLYGSISGTLTIPNTTSGKIPVVIIMAGNGPTDRDGNNAERGIYANTYKLLAYALGKNGIASLRYDKRMVGQSVTTEKEKELSFEDYTDDAVSLIGMLGDDQRFSKIIIAGHGDGALAGMLATDDEPISQYISIEGASEPADKIMTDEMKSQPPYVANEFKAILDSLRKGKITDNVDPALYHIARASMQPYIMSWCRYDPLREIKKIKIPVLLIQGTTDLEVSVDNGEKLNKAKTNAILKIIRGMNYVLKDAPIDKEQNLATYKNPDLPLNKEMVQDSVDFINGVKN
jgi:pimeloyl-ACP methyl ester carboxylesterase